MKQFNKLFFLLLILAAVISGCKEEPLPEPKEDDIEVKEKAPALTQNVNQFIKDGMNLYYLWYSEMPDIDIRYEFDSELYFDKLLYDEDKWSWITDDVEALLNSFEGKETSFGYSLAFGRFDDTQTIFALVEFVYPNTPAAEVGLKRGDIIFRMNNADIIDENYLDLLNSDQITVSFGQYVENQGIINVNDVSMISEELNLNPVVKTEVVEHEGHKIGYLFYAQYIDNYNTSLDTAFQYFLDEQVTDVVLDLRYNPGGRVAAAQYLCSSIAPASVVNDNKLLITYQYNDKLENKSSRWRYYPTPGSPATRRSSRNLSRISFSRGPWAGSPTRFLSSHR
ncbi:MAG: S41 family peptidase, partial [bacterium]